MDPYVSETNFYTTKINAWMQMQVPTLSYPSWLLPEALTAPFKKRNNLFKLQHWTFNSWAIECVKLNATLTKLTHDPFSNDAKGKASLCNCLILHYNSSHLVFIQYFDQSDRIISMSSCCALDSTQLLAVVPALLLHALIQTNSLTSVGWYDPIKTIN